MEKFYNYIFSLNEPITRKQYLSFFAIFSVVFFIALIIELILSVIIYMSFAYNFLGNFNFLLFPIMIASFLLIIFFSFMFFVYTSFSIKRAKDFSQTPIKHFICYCLLLSLIGFFVLISNILSIWQLALIIYIFAFLPYLFFDKNETD